MISLLFYFKLELYVTGILRGYGSSLYKRDKDKPRRKNEATPAYVLAFEALSKLFPEILPIASHGSLGTIQVLTACPLFIV